MGEAIIRRKYLKDLFSATFRLYKCDNLTDLTLLKSVHLESEVGTPLQYRFEDPGNDYIVTPLYGMPIDNSEIIFDSEMDDDILWDEDYLGATVNGEIDTHKYVDIVYWSIASLD